MLKFKVAKKAFAHEEIYSVGNCKLQNLFRYEDPIAYSENARGWACDYYQFDDIYISTGYSPIGKSADDGIIEKYENAARQIFDDYGESFETRKQKLKTLIKHFLNEIKTLEELKE